MTARTCAGCDLCCTVLDVDELEKPAGQRCGHLEGKPGCNCAIYPRRPESCSGFMCFWRLGFGPEKFKPSQVGFVLAIRTPDASAMGKRGLLTMHVDPARPDCWRTPWAMTRLQYITASNNAAISVNVGADRDASFIISQAGAVYDRESRPDLFRDGKVRTPFLDSIGVKPCSTTSTPSPSSSKTTSTSTSAATSGSRRRW